MKRGMLRSREEIFGGVMLCETSKNTSKKKSISKKKLLKTIGKIEQKNLSKKSFVIFPVFFFFLFLFLKRAEKKEKRKTKRERERKEKEV